MTDAALRTLALAPILASAQAFQEISAQVAYTTHLPRPPIVEPIVRQDIVGLADRSLGSAHASLRPSTPRIVALEVGGGKETEGP